VIRSSPLNWGGYQGALIPLDCAADAADRVQWHEFVTTSLGGIISDGNVLSPGHPNALRYHLAFDNSSDPYWYNLSISESLTADGGRYECSDETTLSRQQAEVVVIDSAPNCTNTVPTDGFVVEGVYYTMECQLMFQATYPIHPIMVWTGAGNFNQLFVQQNNSVMSGISFYVQRAMDGRAFDMIASFDSSSGFGQGPNMATNIPTFTAQYHSNQLFVMWPPTNMSYAPVKPSYEVGDVLTCYSDANPWPTYTWTSMHDLVDYPSQTLTLVDAMIGIITLRCQSRNQYGSANLIVNITVNARTTTPPTTPTPPTTTVAAVANCDNLSGRWEFQRSSTSTAVLCVYVDTAGGGTLSGLLWNDTATETYYMEIFGRTRNGIYDETGFTGIWPLQVGVSAFAGECHKCYGTESFLVNVLSRSSKDGDFCGDGGTLLDSPQFSFRRVPTSYPCSDPTTMRSLSRQAAMRHVALASQQ